MAVSIYGDRVHLPEPLAGERFCIIVDICQETIFLMLPEQSRDLLEKFEMFKLLKNRFDFEIRPRGIGLSLSRHINVRSNTTELQLWNGDRLFKYPVFPEANVWIGGETRMTLNMFNMKGETDIYLKMPSPVKLLKSVFLDEWNLLMSTEVTTDMAINFKLFGFKNTIRFADIGVASADIFVSLGGTQPRQWCGSSSNPPGMFLSMMVSTSPFKHIPILEDWIFDYPTRLYVVFMTDSGSSSITANETDILSDFLQLEWMISRFTNLTVATVSEYELLLSNESLLVAQDLQRSLNKTSDQIQSVTKTLYTNGSLNIDWKHIGELFADIWNDGWTSINYDTTRFVDSIEFNRRLVKYNNTNLFLSERDRIEQTLKTTASKFANQVFSISKNYKGLGFHFTATLSVFHLKFGKLEVEAVHSVDRLGACSKFKEAFEIFEKESPFRFIGIVSGGYVKLGFLLYLDVGARISFAFSVDTPGKVLINFYAKASILGIETSADVLINNKEIFFHAEGKVWNTFKANLTALADHGKDWNELTFHFHGELIGNSDKDGNFEDSYTDAFRKVLNGLGDSAIHRITQAQKAFTRAASGLTAAQNWLQSKKSAVRSVNIAFNSAFYSLNRAKDALERAKSSLKTADVRLHQAQMRLDKLCKIKTCQKLCVQGLKCQICYIKVWFRLIPYPCCDLTKCMLYIPNPVCIARNIGCRAVRHVAFGALDVTKLPMFVLDDAQVAVSVAQMVVDKSRIELDITLGAIDFAKIGLEGAEFVLRNASIVQEGVKVAVKIGLKVADLISEYGVQSLIEVKNCNFDIDISTRSLSVFAVECDLNAFRLGWIPIKFMINFNRPIQSLWESAKATIKAITDSVAGQSLFGRGKGEFLHEALFKTHKILRAHEDVDVDLDTYLNETIDIIFQTAGYENATLNEDYENRVAIFRRKCTQFQHIVSFLGDTNNVLYDIANETYTTLRAAADMYDHLEMYAIDQIRSNLSLKSIGISPMEALRDFNITKDDLELALNNSKESLKNDSLLSEIQNISQILKSYIEESTEAAESVRILDQWFSAMENVTLDYFDSDVCVSFLDCAHYSIAELLGLYYGEEFNNVSDIFYMLSSLEDTFLELTSSSSHPIQTVYNLSNTIHKQLVSLKNMNPYCSIPPTFVSTLSNRTVTVGDTSQFYCDVSGTPELSIWWFKNGVYLPEEHEKILTIENVTRTDAAHIFRCIAGNVVANLSSDHAYLLVEDKRPYAITDQVTDLRPIFIPTFASLAVLTFIVGVIFWRFHKRNKVEKDKARGSYSSLNMAILSANTISLGDQPISSATTEQIQ